jgi:hypothetical protein
MCLPRHCSLRRSSRPCWYSTATIWRVFGDMKVPRPLSILYGSSLRECTCRRGAQDVVHVFFAAARRTRAVCMRAVDKAVYSIFGLYYLPHHGWPQTILEDDRVAHAVRAVRVVRAKDARASQVHRRLPDVHRALGRVPIRILRSRHQLSFQCLFSRVRCPSSLHSQAHQA